MIIETHRNQEWLENLLADIWYKYFLDVAQTNTVFIRYGRKAKRRLGSISLDKNNPEATVITINPIYQDLDVPEYVVQATIIHEMTHYAHGFNSPHKQKHKHPHSGGVIRKEFAERGLEEMYDMQKKWLKQSWPDILVKYFGPQKPTYTVRGRKSIVRVKIGPWWMS